MNRTQLINDLSSFIDWLRSHPELDEYSFSHYLNDYQITVETKEEAIKLARILERTEKEYNDSYVNLRRKFGHLPLRIKIPREEVCRKIVKGTRHVEECVLPAHEEEIVDWVCDEPLLKDSQ